MSLAIEENSQGIHHQNQKKSANNVLRKERYMHIYVCVYIYIYTHTHIIQLFKNHEIEIKELREKMVRQ